VSRVEVKTLTPELAKYHTKFQYELYDKKDLVNFQNKMGE